MISYNIIKKHHNEDTFGIKEQVYNELEKKLRSMVDEKLSMFNLSGYDVEVLINLEENRMSVKSPNLPDDLASQVQSALSSLGNF